MFFVRACLRPCPDRLFSFKLWLMLCAVLWSIPQVVGKGMGPEPERAPAARAAGGEASQGVKRSRFALEAEEQQVGGTPGAGVQRCCTLSQSARRPAASACEGTLVITPASLEPCCAYSACARSCV